MSENTGQESRHQATSDSDVTDVAALVEELLAGVGEQSSGREARTLMSGPRMRAVVMALAEGAEMSEHESPPAATLHVLRGHVSVHGDGSTWEVRAGEMVPIPPHRHAVTAHVDSAFLLTVAL
jgi:quercetin dioxygenase-like cupin family protein